SRSKRREPSAPGSPGDAVIENRAVRFWIRGGGVDARRSRAVTSQNRRRVLATEHGLSPLHQLADCLLRRDACATRRTAAEMFFDELTIGRRKLAVDERSDERINR